jgi:hypothetical protein
MAKRGRKSNAIREILSGSPTATVKEIQAALGAKRIKASVALISKVKAGSRPGRKTNGKVPLNFAHLLLAKHFVKEAGSVEAAREALGQLAKLL